MKSRTRRGRVKRGQRTGWVGVHDPFLVYEYEYQEGQGETEATSQVPCLPLPGTPQPGKGSFNSSPPRVVPTLCCLAWDGTDRSDGGTRGH